MLLLRTSATKVLESHTCIRIKLLPNICSQNRYRESWLLSSSLGLGNTFPFVVQVSDFTTFASPYYQRTYFKAIKCILLIPSVKWVLSTSKTHWFKFTYSWTSSFTPFHASLTDAVQIQVAKKEHILYTPGVHNRYSKGQNNTSILLLRFGKTNFQFFISPPPSL